MIQKILLVLSFFTRLPIGKRDFRDLSLSQSAVAFPISGAIIGAFTGGFYLATHHLGMSAITGAWLAVFFTLILTGAINESGMAASADALPIVKNREEKLAIMRSTSPGSYGVIALIAVISLRATLIASLAGNLSSLMAIIATSACSYSLLVAFMRNINFADSEGMLKAAKKPSQPKTITANAIGVIFLFFTGKIILAITAIFILVAIYSLLKNICEKNFGGITSSALSSVQQISEVALLIVFSVNG